LNLIKIESLKDPAELSVRWSPTNVCNFACEYCWPDSHAATHTAPNNLDQVIANFKHLFNQYQAVGKTKFHIEISGGEPTVWRDLEKFCTSIKEEHDVYITIISNGSRSIRWWKENGHLFDDVVLSYHEAQADVHHHIKVADTLFELGAKVVVSVLMDTSCWDQCVQAIDLMKEYSNHRWFIHAVEVIPQHHLTNRKVIPIFGDDKLLTKQQKEFLSTSLKQFPKVTWLADNFDRIRVYESRATLDNNSTFNARTEDYITKSLNHFYGWTCNVGVDSIYIGWDGSISASCTQPLFDKQYNVLSEKFAEEFNSSVIAPVKCTIQNCFCKPETHVSKHYENI